MKRRTFLKAAGWGSAAGLARGPGRSEALANSRPRPFPPLRYDEREELRNHRIAALLGFRHVCPRPKLIGKNARLDVHGSKTSESVLIVRTDRGLEGVGVGRLDRDRAKRIVGRRLDELWEPEVGSAGRLGRADHPLFDLVGKALGKPAWSLLGGQGPEWVEVYDGSLYFADLLPEYEDRGIDRILEEIDMGLEAGHRAFKIKVGRGHKWMPPKDGFRRDVEVARAIRRRVGPEIRLMVDANNGMDLEQAIRFIDEADARLTFVEEMFPEEVEADLKLKEHLRAHHPGTLVADGESAREVEHFAPFLEAKALDVLQPDIRAFGLSRQWALSRAVEAAGSTARLAPHNWGSFLGLYMNAILGRGVPNFLMAEQDTSASDLFETSAFTFREGRLRVPDVPGCGLALRRDVLEASYLPDAWEESGG